MIYQLNSKCGKELIVRHCCFGALCQLDQLDEHYWHGDINYANDSRDNNRAWEDINNGKVSFEAGNLDSFVWFPDKLSNSPSTEQLAEICKGHPFFDHLTVMDDGNIHVSLSKGCGATMLPLFMLRNIVEYTSCLSVFRKLKDLEYPLWFCAIVAANFYESTAFRGGTKIVLRSQWDDAGVFSEWMRIGQFVAFLKGEPFKAELDTEWGDNDFGYQEDMVSSLTNLPTKKEWEDTFFNQQMQELFNNDEGESLESFYKTIAKVWDYVQK